MRALGWFDDPVRFLGMFVSILALTMVNDPVTFCPKEIRISKNTHKISYKTYDGVTDGDRCERDSQNNGM